MLKKIFMVAPLLYAPINANADVSSAKYYSSNTTLKSDYTIDSSLFDRKYGSPTSKLEYKAEFKKHTFETVFDDNRFFSLSINDSFIDGNVYDTDWYSKNHASKLGVDAKFLITESYLNDFKYLNLKYGNVNYNQRNIGSLSYKERNNYSYTYSSHRTDSLHYIKNSIQPSVEGNTYYKNLDALVYTTHIFENSTEYEKNILSIGGTTLNLSGAISKSLFAGIDKHPLRIDLKSPSLYFFGVGYSAKAGVLLNHKFNENLNLFAGADYKHILNVGIGNFRYQDESPGTTVLLPSSTIEKNIYIGIKYIF